MRGERACVRPNAHASILRMVQAIGIDPGANGAIVLVRATRAGDETVAVVYDMPVIKVRVNGKERKRVDAKAVHAIIASLKARNLPLDKDDMPTSVWIEDAHAMPREGAVGAFTFGRVAGIVETAAHACGLSPSFVSPVVWKGSLRCPADKGKARQLASKLFPNAAHHWTRAKDDGRAEASLIAYYGLYQAFDQLENERGKGKRDIVAKIADALFADPISYTDRIGR
jgi:hypothetical protein